MRRRVRLSVGRRDPLRTGESVDRAAVVNVSWCAACDRSDLTVHWIGSFATTCVSPRFCVVGGRHCLLNAAYARGGLDGGELYATMAYLADRTWSVRHVGLLR